MDAEGSQMSATRQIVAHIGGLAHALIRITQSIGRFTGAEFAARFHQGTNSLERGNEKSAAGPIAYNSPPP